MLRKLRLRQNKWFSYKKKRAFLETGIKFVNLNNLSMELNLSKSTISAIPIISGSTTTQKTNISSELSSVSFSFSQFLNSFHDHFSTTCNKNSGQFQHNVSLILLNFASLLENAWWV